MASVDQAAQPAAALRWRSLLLPLALLGVLVLAFVAADPAAFLQNGAPPAEELLFERVEFRDGEIVLYVRNAVGQDFQIAQVMVDDAFWAFEATPGTTLGRYEAGTVRIPYPWVEGESHVVSILSGSGLVWPHAIPVALPSPQPSTTSFAQFAWIGILVGVLPVVAGMGLYPLLRGLPAGLMSAILAFTLGLLAFLLIDSVGEGIELANAAPGAFQGLGLFVGMALLAVLGVLALERAAAARDGSAAALALVIAVSIGLHNLGEGLIIGSAFAIGSLALGNALILGFAVHNVTEGPAIVSPHVRGEPLRWRRFLLLAALGGLPTVLGTWLGAYSSTGVLPVAFFGLGAGAIAVVIGQVGMAMRREGELLSTSTTVAFLLGYGVMLVTGLLTA